jgi:hypothetical protein
MRGISMKNEIFYENHFGIIKKIIFDSIMFLFLLCSFYFFYWFFKKTNSIIFTFIFALISYYLLLYNEYKSYIFTIKSIKINNDYKLRFTGYKYFKKNEESLDLKNCKYFLIKITEGSASYDLQINYNDNFLYLSSNYVDEEEVFKIYNILKAKYPENDLGQKWKYIIIGNTW